MNPLREKMINTMILRGFSPKTQESYLYWVTDLAKYYRCSPDRLDIAQIEQYFLYLHKERHLAANTVRLSLNSVRYFFTHVLKRERSEFRIAYPKSPSKIPDLLTREEVCRILVNCSNIKHHALLSTAYAAGLRVSELVALQVRNIDSKKHVLHIKQAKGAKDREVPLSNALLYELRQYWKALRPYEALFYSTKMDHPLGVCSAQRVFKKVKTLAKINKVGGIHSLRHAYATHQLEAGMPINCLQHAMGHKHISTTMRYVHWLPYYQNSGISRIDLLQW